MNILSAFTQTGVCEGVCDCLPGLLCRTAIRHCSGVLKKSDDITLCSPSAQPACKEYIHVINHIKTVLHLHFKYSSTIIGDYCCQKIVVSNIFLG